MNKIQKLLQCIRLRRRILGKVGRGNKFCAKVTATSASIIGNYNQFSDRCMVGNAVIGNYCSFGPDVKIGQSQHSIDYITTFQKISSKNIDFSLITEPAIIDSDVWVGANAVVLQGVHIGIGAVIGANAVVSHDVPPYAIVVGVPAKILRYRFDEGQRNMLLESKWWELNFDEACRIVDELAQKCL